ncbi:MAG: L-aspartate oxidase [Candidatus Margulisbacteria bacterium]|jgi:L-aspartate oxidase|nr:L-aspartate oxidase [Candidatus Margulisiibacteriota bacterium]
MINKIYEADTLIIGAGVAGLSAAIRAVRGGAVALAHKGAPNISATQLAQGGIAVALDRLDSPRAHYLDTLYAGAGLCDRRAVRTLVRQGIPAAAELLNMGVFFDRDERGLALGREAAHSHRRILHAGDSTGAEVERGMAQYLQKNQRGRLTVYPETQCLELLLAHGVCAGAVFLNKKNEQFAVLARCAILATGGYVQIFKHNTNPPELSGDGIALACRAGARIRDMEFVQFHPTALHTGAAGQQFLISEAVRGEGAVLRNVLRRRFMPDYHPLAELAPRDIVARASVAEMRKTNADHVLLDFTTAAVDPRGRFPAIYRQCRTLGINIAKDLVPVVPAAHYAMGGIAADIHARTSIPGLLACGECASAGLHGANRLASNSLLEGLVFGRRAAETALRFRGVLRRPAEIPEIKIDKPSGIRAALQEIMWRGAGIIRDRAGLEQAGRELDRLTPGSPAERNLLLCARLCLAGALRRRESRGAHYRADYPRRRLLYKRRLCVVSTSRPAPR